MSILILQQNVNSFENTLATMGNTLTSSLSLRYYEQWALELVYRNKDILSEMKTFVGKATVSKLLAYF